MSDPAILRKRAGIVREIRRFFDERDFVEVETAVRIPAPAPEKHIDCPPVGGGGYLRASPEIQMKKLLAAGMDRIYQIGPCFREGERGSRHNPEFTMIEWYRRNATYLDIREDLESLLAVLRDRTIRESRQLQNLSPETGGTRLSRPLPCGRGRDKRVSPEVLQQARSDEQTISRTICVRDAYLRYAGWDPWAGDWDQDRFDFDMATKIEPAIGRLGGGVFLTDYPPQAASLSKLSTPSPSPIPHSPSLPFAERWEFYYDGMELANCFTELCDGGEQRRRFVAEKAARKAIGESDYPLDDGFLTCLSGIGSAAGVALGVDRLVMILTQAKEISAVRADI